MNDNSVITRHPSRRHELTQTRHEPPEAGSASEKDLELVHYIIAISLVYATFGGSLFKQPLIARDLCAWPATILIRALLVIFIVKFYLLKQSATPAGHARPPA
jgi:hypothetical protein